MKTETDVLSRLLVSTHRKKRPFNIFEIAEDIVWLSNHLGSLSEVSDVLNISTGMLNQFLHVYRLSDKAKELVKIRVIDSVTVVHNLSKFSIEDQDEIINKIVKGILNYNDIRLVNPLRKQFPEISISEIIQKLKISENRKISVIKFPSDLLHKSIEQLRSELSNIIGPSEVVDLVLDEDVGSIKVTPQGEQLLRNEARRYKKTLQEYTQAMLE